MRYVRYLCNRKSSPIALIAVALPTGPMVSLKVLRTEVSGWFAMNPEIQVPLFLVILGSNHRRPSCRFLSGIGFREYVPTC